MEKKLMCVMLSGMALSGIGQALPQDGVFIGLGLGGGHLQSVSSPVGQGGEFDQSPSASGVLQLGYQLDSIWGVEFGAMTIYNQSFSWMNNDISVARGTYLAVDYFVPFNEHFRGVIKVGASYNEYISSASVWNSFFTSKDGAAFNTGIGFYSSVALQGFLTEHLSASVYVQSSAYAHSFYAYGIGLSYHF